MHFVNMPHSGKSPGIQPLFICTHTSLCDRLLAHQSSQKVRMLVATGLILWDKVSAIAFLRSPTCSCLCKCLQVVSLFTNAHWAATNHLAVTAPRSGLCHPAFKAAMSWVKNLKGAFFFFNPYVPEENLGHWMKVSDLSCFFLGGKNSYLQAVSCAASVQLWEALGHTAAKTTAILNSLVL